MNRAVAGDLERFAVTCIGKHGCRISADKHRLTCEKPMVVIKVEEARMPRDTAVITGYLPVIFANVFQSVKLKGPYCPR